MTDDHKEPQMLNILLLDDDVRALIEILDFADRAAGVLAHQEIQKGSGITAAANFNRLSKDAKDFAKMLIDHIDIGEPDGNIH